MGRPSNAAAVRARLLAERDELARLSDAARDDRKPVALDQQSVGRLSRMDAIQQQEMSLAADRRRQARITAIDAALKRLDGGEWGYCISCGDEIPPKRLEFDPAAALCIRCAAEK